MQIEITKVELTPKKVNLTGKDGKLYSGFINDYNGKPTGLADLKDGDIIEADITVKDQYNNIKSFKKIGQPAQSAPAPSTAGQTSTPIEVSGPERGMATNKIMDAWIAGQLDRTHPLVQWAFDQLYRIAGVKK